jgi:hypothetical protein
MSEQLSLGWPMRASPRLPLTTLDLLVCDRLLRMIAISYKNCSPAMGIASVASWPAQSIACFRCPEFPQIKPG